MRSFDTDKQPSEGRMTTYDFDRIIDRRSKSDSEKWRRYPPDVLPLWVADMDFPSPQPVLDAMQRRIDHGIFGYSTMDRSYIAKEFLSTDSPGELDHEELRELFCERLRRLYNWAVRPQELIFIPGLVLGIHLAAQAYGRPGQGIMVQSPVYGPFLSVPPTVGKFVQQVDLSYVQTGDDTFSYEIDFDAFEDAISRQTGMLLLCNPHNPGGRVFTRDELERLAEICLRHKLLICSDEIHCDLLLDDVQHIPMAALSPEISASTITLMAPSKTFNLAGLGCSMAIVQNPELRFQLGRMAWSVGHVNTLAYEAMLAAYRDGDEWLQQLLVYLRANRDYVVDFIRDHMPGLRTTVPEATYLAWLDCRGLELGRNPYDFFLEEAKVALNTGAFFGRGAEGFVRLNFACPRALLTEALERMRDALAVHAGR